MRAVSLFSGGLGLDLGLEEAGIEAACYVEADADCLRLIRSRRPGVPVLEDVKEATAETLAGEVDVVAGGFPCQDLSYAGRGAGLHEGERSALWFEMLRIVEDVRPRLVLAENVPGLLTRGLPVVLHGLARAGYVGRWFAVSAASVGAPHLRERIFVAARRVDDGVRAERLGEGHPVGEFRDDGWFDLQGSLFDQEPLRRLGKRGRWTLEAVFEEDGRLALDDGAEETLPYESTPTAEVGRDPSEALLPTPRTNDGTGTFPKDRPEHMDNLATRIRRMPTPTARLGREGGGGAQAKRYTDPRRSNDLDDAVKWLGEQTREEESFVAPEKVRDIALLPTPQAHDAVKGKTPEQIEAHRAKTGGGAFNLNEVVENGIEGGGQLLPTPAARDAKGPHTEDREGGLDLGSAAQKLLPTPVVTDSFGSRRSTARTDEWTSNPGTTLTDAIWEAQGRETDTRKLLPTPTAATGGDGERPDGFRRLLAPEIRRLQDEALLPTPVANPDNPGSGGELRAALEHGPERRNGTGVDSLGRPNEGRPSRKLMPTPTAEDGERGQNADDARDGGPTLAGSVRLLPTPQAADGDGGRQEKGAMRAGGKRPSGQKGTLPLGTAVTLADEIGESPFTEREQTESLMPTPQAADGDRVSEQGPRHYETGEDNPTLLGAARRTEVSWGVYEAAIRRWEATCGREAPAPTDDRGRLSPAFVEWMMDYPEGWISGLVLPDKDPRPDRLSRTAALRILGNSVVVRVGYRAGLALLALDRELSGT